MYNPFTLEGKTILITGASSGIGKSTAIVASKMGAHVVITGRNNENLQDTYSMLVGSNNSLYSVDLTNEDERTALVDKLPFIDGLVHCAGITKNIPFQFATRPKLDEVLEINFYAPAELTRLFLKSKKINKNSSIVFVSSISGVYCSAISSSIYSASKGAINGLVKGMAIDLASKGIRVNCINPGMVETKIFESGVITSDQLEIDKTKYPLKRYGKPEEIAFAAIYLLSDASSWVTGSNILIDGGYTLL